MEENQLFNLAIPAPVLDGRSIFGDGAEPPRKYCTHGLKVPLQVSTTTEMRTLQFLWEIIQQGHSPYHPLKHWSEHLIPRRYPDNHSPFDVQTLSLRTHEVRAFLIGDGCREADVGGDALEVCLLEAKVEAKRRRSGADQGGYPRRLVMFVVCRNLANVRGRHGPLPGGEGSETEKWRRLMDSHDRSSTITWYCIRHLAPVIRVDNTNG